MRLTTLLLFVTLPLLGQTASDQNKRFHISGQIELQDLDQVEADAKGLLTKYRSQDSIKTKVFKIEGNGSFKIDSLASGLYRLAFRVSDDYRYIDTLITVTTENFVGLIIKPRRRECDYDTNGEIDGNNITILVACDNGLRPNTKSDNNFERKFKVRYLILAQPHSYWNCFKRNNEKMFKFLDEKYGMKWRKDVRKDSIGI